ncbi:MAG: penicillin-binding protein 2 [Candidatus Eremiobacteraeota bacterium]|nr:penicillin-binding protein 2 [Candidatus Eremiobacteraeota bacterium]
MNRAIARLALLFVFAYAVLFARQLYVQIVEAPRLARDVHNPRTTLIAAYRGAIVARDGTVLARSTPHGRIYPLGAALAHTVGYASARYGNAGLEAAFDADLAPRPLGNDPLAQLQALVTKSPLAAARPGTTVVTTIDPVVERALDDGLRQYPRGAGVALDPRTGEILAIASVPSFDPERVDADFATVRSDPASPLLDRALDGLYPPGSTFKIVIAAAALDAGVVTMDSTFEDDGALPVGNFVVHDDEGEATGSQDLTGAFALSSNVDFARIALSLGVDRWYAAAARFRLGDSLDFPLPVARDRLPARATVSPSILAQRGFGQADLLVTPLRMALIAATVAAGGVEPHPELVRALRRDGRDELLPAAEPLATPMTAGAANELRTMMVAVVERGSGKTAALPDVQVAGKTGTATNPGGRSHSWFVAFAPASAPRIAVAIVVENVGYGAVFAAPIARRVIAAALAHERS